MNFAQFRSHFIGVVGAFSLVASAQAADVAELLSKAEASKLLGQPVVNVSVIGPEKDDDAPAMGIHWIYRASDAAVVVTRMTFASPAEAQKFATPEAVKKQVVDSESKVSAEPGVGEKSFWAISAEGATWTFLKGNQIASVGLGGKKGASPESYKTALKAAALTVAAKL